MIKEKNTGKWPIMSTDALKQNKLDPQARFTQRMGKVLGKSNSSVSEAGFANVPQHCSWNTEILHKLLLVN